ncbi:MAG: hypothetical protein ACYDEY_15635 [Acidimicrobiales bacterium]
MTIQAKPRQDKIAIGKAAAVASAVLGLVGLVAGAFVIAIQRLLWVATFAIAGIGLWSTYA